MPLKDYYKILSVAPNADATTIKKAFRKLAMQYHPDKNEESQSSTIFFREVQTAYDILSNPEKREQYHYQRWLEKSKGHELDTAITAEQILQLFINTERMIHETDSFRRENNLIKEILISLYTSSRIDLMIEKENSELEKTTIILAMHSSKSLDAGFQIQLTNLLDKLIQRHPELAAEWEKQIKVTQKKEFIEKLKLPAVILITILLCIIILLISK